DYIGFGLMALGLACLELTLDLGQQKDWFASSFIVFTAVSSAVLIISFVVWELYTPEPIVNLRVFLNRNFAVGCALIATVGVVLYGSTALLPLFLQTLLGYPAVESGMAVSPRGIGAIVSMVIVGRLISRVDSRYLIAFGFCVLTISTHMFVGLNLYIAQSNIVYPMLISGFAMGFVFVPLTTMTMATLPQDQIGNASGIYNLMRNTGGSVGISILAFLLARGSQVHQAYLTAHTTQYDPAFQQMVDQIKSSMAGVDSVTATQQAYQTIYGMLVKQAMVLSYLDCFWILTVMCSLCIPAAFLFKRVRNAKPVEGAH
ncbi:MAG TPA: DHA2 family efflux MFS transporter permease subunit, partial [Pyrinomonadaceae bacterium]|nr:DHA2 family efflux MFS transporter permease subunit [Pyrinomonadaceae bacterium]